MSLHDNRAEGEPVRDLEPDVSADTEMNFDFDKDYAEIEGICKPIDKHLEEVEEICKPINKHLEELADFIWKRHREFLIKALYGNMIYKKLGQVRLNPVYHNALVADWGRFTSELMQGFKCHRWDGEKEGAVTWYLKYRWVGEKPNKPIIHPFSLSRHKEILASIDAAHQDIEMGREEEMKMRLKLDIELAEFEAKLKRQELVSQILQAANEKAQRYTDIVILNEEIPAMMEASCNFPRFVCAHPHRNLHPYTDAPLAAEQTRYLDENWKARCYFEQASGKPYSSVSWYTIEWSDKEPVVKKSCCIIC
jgi:hypothetical protein